MSPIRPMLDDVELQQVQTIQVDGDQVLVQHGVPALEGDFFQGLGRRATQIALSGVLTGPEAGAGLKTLRDKFRAAEPVPFVADIATATRVGQVLIEEMGVRELAGKPERFEYAFTLREYSPPPEVTETPPEIETPENPDEDIDQGVGTLIVEVIVEGQSGFDFSRVTVTVQGTQADGSSLSRTLTNRTDNIWTAENVPASQGEYIVQAMETNPQPLSGSTTVAVQVGQRKQASITLHPSSIIAKAFVIHFDHDKAFIRPCMRAVLQQVADYSNQHRNEKLLIVGHTDKTGINPSEPYNQSLSERRARSAYAYLTFGITPDASVAEWNLLRQQRTRRQLPTVHDTWAEHEYQYMLQDLGFYPYKVDGRIGDHTNAAIEAFRCQHGLPPGQTIDPQTWEELIRAYLRKANLGIPPERFLPNCGNEALKWLGSGEEDPVRNTSRAWRPNRRTEFLFVRASALPCDVPNPDTFDIPQPPAPNVVGSNWCLDPGGATTHHCYVTPASSLSCPQNVQNQWCRPAPPPTITVQGSIKREVRLAGGTTRLDPAPNQKFVLIAPNGVVKASETASGESNPARTDSNGEFSFADLPSGIYTLEVHQNRGSVLIRRDPPGSDPVTGNTICAHLEPGQDRLDVVILSDPILREIRLPVVAHLMTARVDTFLGLIMILPLHRTSRTEADVRRLFEGVNDIWRQARIHFDVKDVVELSYTPPAPAQRVVSQAEFHFLMTHCAFPNVINVFFVENLAGQTAYFSVSRDRGAAESGCVLPDSINEQQSVVFLAQAMGSVLNLGTLTDPSTLDRLMHGGIVRTDTRLIDSEISTVRSSRGAQQECFPLEVKVTGATQMGGSKSPNYFAVRQSGEILVEALVKPDQLALGTLTVSGGSVDPANPYISRIDRNTPDRTEVTSTFTMNVPTSTGMPPQVYTHRVRIIVVEFDLVVRGIDCSNSAANLFIARQHPTQQVVLEARISRLPTCIPNDIVLWEGAEPDPDDPRFPLQVRVPKSESREITIDATFAGTTESVIVRVISLAFTTNSAPFNTVIGTANWDDAFRLRADLPGESLDQIAIEVESFFVRR